MKKYFSRFLLLICLLTFSLLIVGCGDNTDVNKKGEYNESDYTFDSTYSYETVMTFDEAQELLNKALTNLQNKKNYSYSEDLKGLFDGEYEVSYSGIARINMVDSVEASMELTGNLNFAMYIKDGNVYINFNDQKTCQKMNNNIEELLSSTTSSLGSLPSLFTMKEENLNGAGVNDKGVSIIEYVSEDENGEVTIIIYEEQIMKVLYKNDNDMTYVANYNYDNVTVSFPDDLDSYTVK